MDMNIWNHNKAVHIAIVVNDINQVLDNYCKIFQIEKPMIKMTGEPDVAKVKYRGQSTKAMAKQAFLQFGMLRIEFLEPDEHESTWREYLEKNRSGVHHIAFEIINMDDVLLQLEKENILLVQEGEFNMGCYAYVESEEKLDVMIELLEYYI